MKSIAATLVALAWLVGSASAVEAATVSWNVNPEPDIAAYVLSYGTVSGTYTTAIYVGNTTTVLVALTPGVQYFFVVQAYNTSGLISPPSAEVAFTVDPGAPVFTAQPAGQTVAAGQGASFSVATNGTPEPTYQWQISTNGGASWINLENTGQYGGVTTGTLTLAAGTGELTGAEYRAVATSSAGTTPSNAARLTVEAPALPVPSGPAAPNSPNVADGQAGVATTPNLSWQAAGATSYELRISTANPPSTYVSDISTYYYVPQLAGGTRYFWQVVASNSGGSTTGPVWSFTTDGASTSSLSFPAAQGTGAQISVLTWNIQVSGDSSETHARLAIDLALAASPRPQIITFQEAWSQLMPVYVDELQRQTGQTWYGVSQPHCLPGGWNGSSCTQPSNEVVAIFSTFPIGNTDAIYLPAADCWTSARQGLRAALNVNGTTVQVFTTYLQTGGCNNDAQSRYNSMSLLKSWAANYSTPQLFSGDFNADPDQIDTPQGMAGPFLNPSVTLGLSKPLTAFAPSPSMQLDYWFYDASGRVQPVSIDVPENTGTVSHRLPVRATFMLR